MPLNIRGDKLSGYQIFAFSNTIFPMMLLMAIGAQYYQVFFCIIIFIMIFMMHYQHIRVIIPANETFKPSIFDSICETSHRIFNFTFQANTKSCTFSGTKFLNSTLECNSSSNNFAAKIAWESLYTCKRTINTAPAEFIPFKYLLACRAYFCNIRIFIMAGTRTIRLPYSFAQIMSFKCFSTNLTSIHAFT